MNVMLLSVAVWSGAADSTRDLMHWISAAIALPAVAFAGAAVLPLAPARALRAPAARHGRADLDRDPDGRRRSALRETILSGPRAYFEAAIMLTFFLLVGRYLAHRTRAAARSAAAELAALEVHDRRAARARRRPRDRAGRRAAPGRPRRRRARAPHSGRRHRRRRPLRDRPVAADRRDRCPRPSPPATPLRAGMLNLTGAADARASTRLGEDTLLAPDRPRWSRPPSAAAAATPPSPSAPRAPTRRSCSSSPSPALGLVGPDHRRLAPGDQRRRRGADHHLPLRPRPRGARRC